MMSICNIKLTSGSWDLTNQTLMSSWHCFDNGRYPAERNPSGSYTTAVSSKIMPRLCVNWKIKASGEFSLIATSWEHRLLMTSWARPYDILVWFYKSKKGWWDKDFFMKEGIRITCLKLNSKTYMYYMYFFYQKFYQNLFDLYQLNKFILS